METKRQFIRKLLERSFSGVTVDQIQTHLYHEYGDEVPASAVLDDLEHLRHSLRNEDGVQLLGAPPECKECGFDGFDDILNIPSNCPDCRSEWLLEPKFTIENEE